MNEVVFVQSNLAPVAESSSLTATQPVAGVNCCRCGCGRVFDKVKTRRLYFNDDCRWKHYAIIYKGYQIKYRLTNNDALRAKAGERKKSYYQANKQAFAERRRLHYKKNRKEMMPIWSLRNRIRTALKSVGVVKNRRTEELLGCTVSEARKYIQSHFSPGMSWCNFGEWEIDHIIPCSAFDLSKHECQLMCFNFSNLQPLWKSDNRKKGNRLDWSPAGL